MGRPDIYDPTFVGRLFDEMARTYGFVNLIASFGFAHRWRRQCVRSIRIAPGSSVLDLMSGMGELCPDLLRRIGPVGQLQTIDISPVMCAKARERLHVQDPSRLKIIQGDALHCPLPDESVDYVVCSFGLKTFNRQQIEQLAMEVYRVLRPGGQFAFLEISVPTKRLLRWPYMLYLRQVIPVIGRFALGNPDNYRLLGVYTTAFQDCQQAAECFQAAQLQVEYQSYFFGCATGLTGMKFGTVRK